MQLANLEGKQIIVGITGGIAAYKTLFLIRLLTRSGAKVKAVMTPSAAAFITPLTVSTLCKELVLSDFSSGEHGEAWNNHVELGLWADAMIIAPATANTLSKMAHGHCNNLLLATYLSARCPVIVVPAMDVDMWVHPSTQRNILQLQEDKVFIVPPAQGELASGLSGMGRMQEPEKLLPIIEEKVTSRMALIPGLQVLVTAGPTYESFDPVRFIGNWSSGKMGIAVAEEFHLHGAHVTLVQGPGNLVSRFEAINTIRIRTADEMYLACEKVWAECHVGIFAAAVADYKPSQYHHEKISKEGENIGLKMDRTPDIAAILGQRKRKNQMMIGFAMETGDKINNAKKKLDKKNLDLIVLNSLLDEGSGFGTDTNKVTFISRHGNVDQKKLKSKQDVAHDIVAYVSNNYSK